MKKLLAILLTLCLLSISAAGLAETTEAEGDFGVFPALAGEAGTTYVSLFDLILKDEYATLWHDYIAPVMGEGASEMAVAGLQGSISGELYGEDAIAYFTENPEHLAFDCYFINGVDAFTFSGSDVTVALSDGTSETHTYEYLGQYNVGDGETMNYMGQEISVAFPCDVYKSTDEAGEFNYFFLRDDTMASTYHTEFRYGRDLEDLQGYFVGPYAYWLVAGIDAEADEETIENVIGLFCLENMSYDSHADEALAQLGDLGFVGTWQADLAPLGDAYAGVELSMTIDAQGHGVTTMNGEQTADFEAFAADTGDAGDGEGMYVAFSNMDNTAESAPYIMSANEDGQAVLTLVADDGTLSWVKQDGEAAAETAEAAETDEAAEVIEIDSAEALAAINDNLSGSYVLTADIDLAGTEWTPIGAYAPSGESAEEQEIPTAELAFTGTFDGQDHTISNLVVNQPEGWAVGLFGCAANADIGNFALENATVDGTVMAADVVGYAFCSTVHDVVLSNGKVTAHASEMSGEGMYGGIVGAGFFNEAVAEAMGAPFDAPTVFNLSDCTAEGVTLNGEALD